MKEKIKKILLIAPPAYTFKSQRDVNPLPPMGLGYLASVIENMGIEVRIVDCLVHGWNHEEEINNEIIRVGLSDNVTQIWLVLTVSLADNIKYITPCFL